MADIYIVGLGVLNVDHITRETERVIRRSNEVLYVDTGVATQAYLEGLSPRVTSLFATSYEEDGNRLNAYHHMAARVLDAAMDHPPVTFAMHGHPIVGVRPFGMVLPADPVDCRIDLDCVDAEIRAAIA